MEMNRKIVFAPDEFYHLYNRGTDRREIFLDDRDRRRFVALLYLCNGTKPMNMREIMNGGYTYEELFQYDRGEPLVAIGAYCLMNNHFHLLVKEKSDQGVSRFMQKFITAYAMYFNTRHKRTGTLFQGRFHAEHADNDEYLKYLYAYIHLNPVKTVDLGWSEGRIASPRKAEQFLKNYEYSSFLDYVDGNRPVERILEQDAFPEYFETSSIFSEMIKEWLNFDKGLTFAKV
jgi:REP element-mobilizing transposase RayT